MASYYIKNGQAGSDNGSSWANAAESFAGLFAAVAEAAGDVFYVSDNHAESTAAATTITLPGTLASPNLVICGDDAAEPPTALATTGSVATGAGPYNLVINGCAYLYGLTFSAGVGSSSSGILLKLNNSSNRQQVYESCTLENAVNNTSARIYVGYDGGGSIEQGFTQFRNCNFKFANASAGISAWSRMHWDGGAITLGTAPTTLFIPSDTTGYHKGEVLVENVDLTNMGTYLVNIADMGPTTYRFRNCNLKTGWAAITGTDNGPGWKVIIENCHHNDTNIPTVSQYHDYYGSVVQSYTIKVTSGGAGDGTNTFAWQMTCDADCEWPMGFLASPEIAVWNTTVGSAVTLSVEINHDSQGSGTSGRMTDKDMWLEVRYQGTSGSPLGKTLTDAAGASTSLQWGSPIPAASAADQTTSATSWGGSITNPEPQTLSVQVTPQEIGYIQVRVCCAKASAVVYVDPKVTVS